MHYLSEGQSSVHGARGSLLARIQIRAALRAVCHAQRAPAQWGCRGCVWLTLPTLRLCRWHWELCRWHWEQTCERGAWRCLARAARSLDTGASTERRAGLVPGPIRQAVVATSALDLYNRRQLSLRDKTRLSNRAKHATSRRTRLSAAQGCAAVRPACFVATASRITQFAVEAPSGNGHGVWPLARLGVHLEQRRPMGRGAGRHGGRGATGPIMRLFTPLLLALLCTLGAAQDDAEAPGANHGAARLSDVRPVCSQRAPRAQTSVARAAEFTVRLVVARRAHAPPHHLHLHLPRTISEGSLSTLAPLETVFRRDQSVCRRHGPGSRAGHRCVSWRRIACCHCRMPRAIAVWLEPRGACSP